MRRFYIFYKPVKIAYFHYHVHYAVVCGRFIITVNWDYLYAQARRKQLQIGGTHYRLGGGAHIIFFNFILIFFLGGGGGHICANYWGARPRPPCRPPPPPPYSYGPDAQKQGQLASVWLQRFLYIFETSLQKRFQHRAKQIHYLGDPKTNIW